MPTYTVTWEWEEAFDKFGFDDGDGIGFTGVVATFIENLGYTTEYSSGIHNEYFDSIKDNSGKELIGEDVATGYDDPKEYLPKSLVEKLNKHFNEEYSNA